MSNEHEEQDGQASSRDGDDDVEAQDEDRKEDRKGQAKQDLAQRPQDRSVNRGTKQEENHKQSHQKRRRNIHTTDESGEDGTQSPRRPLRRRVRHIGPLQSDSDKGYADGQVVKSNDGGLEKQAQENKDMVVKEETGDQANKEEDESEKKIKIELDLEADVDLYAKVKGDVIIGLSR